MKLWQFASGVASALSFVGGVFWLAYHLDKDKPTIGELVDRYILLTGLRKLTVPYNFHYIASKSVLVVTDRNGISFTMDLKDPLHAAIYKGKTELEKHDGSTTEVLDRTIQDIKEALGWRG